MKIYSWNVLFKNREIDDVLTFIERLDFDILALQEVSEELLESLKKLPYSLACSVDTDRTDETGKTSTDSLVILSRHSIENQESIVFPAEWYQEPVAWQTKIASKLLSWRHPYKNKSGLRVEVSLPDSKRVQILCAHLAVVFATPATRQKEFDFLMQKRNKGLPVVFCGDFNILELPHITLLNWLSGGKLTDWMFWWKERQVFRKMFQEYSLQNPLKGMTSHPIALSQIDHILVPKDFRIISKKVLRSRFGSDHNPVMVEVV